MLFFFEAGVRIGVAISTDVRSSIKLAAPSYFYSSSYSLTCASKLPTAKFQMCWKHYMR